MSIENLAFVVRFWRDRLTGVTRVRVVRVQEAREVELKDSSFLVRVQIDRQGGVERCSIRDLRQDRVIHVQGGLGLSWFFQRCLFEGDHSELSGSEAMGE